MGKQMDAPVIEYAYPYEIIVIPCENHVYFKEGYEKPIQGYKARLVINFKLQDANKNTLAVYGESIVLVEKETPPTQNDIDAVYIEKKNELIAKVRKEKVDYPATPVSGIPVTPTMPMIPSEPENTPNEPII